MLQVGRVAVRAAWNGEAAHQALARHVDVRPSTSEDARAEGPRVHRKHKHRNEDVLAGLMEPPGQ